MRARVCGGLVVLMLLVLAGGAVAATRTVALTDSSINPVQANIARGDSVAWLNRGTRPHRVASDTGAWRPFVLRPRQSKRIGFAKRGCFRYKVDNRIRGRVSVSAACGGGGSPTSPGLGQSTYRYDITVTGNAHTVQRHSGDHSGPNSRNGTVDLQLDWTSTYRNIAVKKVATGSTFVLVNASGTLDPGTSNLTFTYNHARGWSGGPCMGTFSMTGLASRVRVSGDRLQGGIGASFGFGSQLLFEPAGAFSDRIHAACEYSDEPRWIEFQGSPEPDHVSAGLTWSDVDPITLLHVSVDRRRAATLFFPLDRLQRGDGFVIQTGPIANEGPCHFGALAPACTETFTGSIRVSFTPRR